MDLGLAIILGLLAGQNVQFGIFGQDNWVHKTKQHQLNDNGP